MAYTPIQPLPTRERPLLGAISEGLSYIRQVNEIKRQENLKRQQEIIGLLSDVDFPTAINMQNQKRQMYLYKAAEDSLMNILSKSAKRNGQISMNERLEADRVIKTLEQELSGITVGEKEYNKMMETAATKPGYYTSESLKQYSDYYINTGESKKDILQFTPVPFSEMQAVMYDKYKDVGENISDIVGNVEIKKKKWTMPLAEKQANYEAMINKSPGAATDELNSFRKLKETDPDMYNQYINRGMNEKDAARKWGLENRAPQLLSKLETGKEELKPKEPKKEDIPIEPYISEEGDITYRVAIQAKPITDKIKYYDENGQIKEKIVNNGKIAQVGYGKLPGGGKGSYIGIVNNSDIDVTSMTDAQAMAWISGAKKSGEYIIVPYKPYSQMIKRQFKLQGIEQLDKMIDAIPEIKEEPKKETTENKWDKYKLK